jgi:hypothetical protein
MHDQRDDRSTPGGVRGEDAVEADQGMTRWRDERTESRQELERGHDAVGLPAARSLDTVRDPSVGQNGESLEAQGCTGAVAQQSLTALAVRRRDRNRSEMVSRSEGSGIGSCMNSMDGPVPMDGSSTLAAGRLVLET